jgi:hypothetical protein
VQTGRPPMSTNLAKYIERRKAGDTERDAALATWTGKRIQAIFGDDVELDVKVTELHQDFDNLPVDEKIVDAVFKPR